MPRLFVGNFDFEHALAGSSGGGRARSERLRRLDAQMSLACLAVAEDGDAIHIPLPQLEWDANNAAARGWPQVTVVRSDAELRAWRDQYSQVELCPWGWTSAERQLAERYQLDAAPPPEAALRAVNSRHFAHELEQELGIALPGSSMVAVIEELPAAIAQAADASRAMTQAARHHGDPDGNDSPASGRWLVKAEFGMAGRERFSGDGGEVTEQLRHWAARRLSAGVRLYVEPWAPSIGEVGLQWTIPRGGSPTLDGITTLFSDSSGTWRGSGFAPDERLVTRWQPAIDITRIAADRIQQAGYCGPVGIDAMQYVDAEGTPRFRPLQDINARFTMGRLSLGLRRWLQPGEQGVWCSLNRRLGDAGAPQHTRPEAAERANRLRMEFPGATRIMPALADSLEGNPPELGFAAVFFPGTVDLATCLGEV